MGNEITSILQEIVTNGSTPHDSSCNWLHANVETWKDWITITPDPAVAHEVNVEKITGYTVGGCIVAGIIGYYLYTSFGLTEEDKVRINVCFSIMGDILTVLMDIADYFTDFYNVSANLVPLADEANKAIIYFAVAILIIAGFVLVFSIYLHVQDALRMCVGSGQKSEEYKKKRFKSSKSKSKWFRSNPLVTAPKSWPSIPHFKTLTSMIAQLSSTILNPSN